VCRIPFRKMRLFTVIYGILDNAVHLLLYPLEFLCISPRKPAIPLSTSSYTLVEMKVVGDRGNDRMKWSLGGVKLAEIQIQREFPDCLRGKLKHIMIGIPGLSSLIEFIEDFEGSAGRHLHKRRIVPDCLWTHCRWKKLVC